MVLLKVIIEVAVVIGLSELNIAEGEIFNMLHIIDL